MTNNRTLLSLVSFLVTPATAVISLFLSTDSVTAQSAFNTWYFGDKAGISFATGAPVAITNGEMTTQEGCASISDTSGNILFYTDGVKVWNRNHVVMPNGSGLTGNFSSTQSALIVQKPGAENFFYIFTSDCQISNFGLRYSEVDMNLNGGNGDITVNKNVFLCGPTDEKLCYTYHCNGRDIWIVTHERGTSNFYSYLLTENGIDPVPVISSVGLSNPTGVGYLKISPDGKKIASAEHSSQRTQLFDFNNTTGAVTNGVVLPQFTSIDGSYGLEYSKSGTKMYVACPHNDARIYQFNLCAGDNNAIANSGVLVGASSASWIGSLQLGPDGKIYVARYLQGVLGVIDNPELAGTACNYIDVGISLAGRMNRLGLPNNSYAARIEVPPTFTMQQNCDTAKFFTPVFSSTNCTSSFDPLLSLSWSFDDPASGANNTSSEANPEHIFSMPGSYTVKLILNFNCRTDSIIRNIIISKPNLELSTIPPECSNPNGSATVIATSHIPISSYTWLPGGQTTASINGVGPGVYTVIVCDSLGCKQSLTANLNGISSTLGILQADTTIMPGSTVALHASGGINYQWSPALGLNCVDCPDPLATPGETTEYCVTATDSSGCSQTKCVNILVEHGETFIPNSFTPNDDYLNDIFKPVTPPAHNYKLQIFNRWGNLVFETDNMNTGWNGAYNSKPCQEGIYAYKLMFNDDMQNKAHRFTGKILLIR